jgi:signal transduction histidine kinase
MTSDMAHELRTPLATLQSHIEAFMDKIWEPDEKRLGMVHEEILRLTGLIKELSDLSIIEGEEIKINKSQVNLSKLIRNIIEKYQPMFIGKNITANIAVENDVVLEADENHLNRIFINLISNAYKYTNENGNLYISLIKLSGFIQVTVEDTGIGIPEEDIKYVFERFYRSDLSRNRGTGGTGIGLTIAKSLIEANQGKISIESVEGKGTKVTCIFYA